MDKFWKERLKLDFSDVYRNAVIRKKIKPTQHPADFINDLRIELDELQSAIGKNHSIDPRIEDNADIANFKEWYESEIKDTPIDEIADLFLIIVSMCTHYSINLIEIASLKNHYNGIR